MRVNDIETYVFSYNRGELLLNLIDSAELCGWNAPITIFDDMSNDSATLKVLAELAARGYRVIRPKHKENTRLGGLYKNMTQALRESEKNIIFFLQDDMQFVREIEDSDMDSIKKIFFNRRSPFILPAFFTKHWGITKRAKYDPVNECYFMDPVRPFGAGSDVCIINKSKLKEIGIDSFLSEQKSDEIFSEHFGSMAVLANPFVAFVPFPKIPRMNIIKRIIASRGVSGTCKYKLLSKESRDRLSNRDKNIPPLDEDYLVVEGGFMQRILSKFFGFHY